VQYNLLPASQLATAYVFADPNDDIPECATFADVGGYVVQLQDMNAIVANAGGTYVEIETAADPHYDSTGAHRFHVNNCGTQPAGSCIATHPALGPTAGPQQELGGISAGVWWSTSADKPGVIHRLGNQSFQDVSDVVLTVDPASSPGTVAFTVTYYLFAQGVRVVEAYNVSAGGTVTVTASAQLTPAANGTRLTRFGVSFPAFLYDGETNVTVAAPTGTFVNASAATLTATTPAGASWGTVTFGVAAPASGHQVAWNWNASVAAQVVCRNGLLAPLDVEVTPVQTNAPSIAYSWTGSGKGV